MAKGKAAIFETIISMSGEVSPALGKSLGEVQKRIEGVNLKALAAGAAVGAIATGTAAAVIGATKYLAKLGDEYNSAMNDIAASTGLAGEELNDMSEVMKDVYANNFGESMEDVAAGLSQVYRTTGLVNDELQAATEAGFALQKTFGYDLEQSSKAASALMKNFGITAEEVYNLMAVGAQNGADQNGDMLDALNEYSAQYAALGLDADQFMASLISGNEAGVFSIDKVGDAVKEFNIRSKDLSKSSAEAYAALGLNADDMFARFAAGGDTAEQAMFEVMDALQNTEDAGVKNAAAVALFGTMYEDLESNLIPVLQTMEGATLDNVNALEQIKEVKYDNFTDAFKGIKRQAEVALLPLASTIAAAFTDVAPVIGKLFEKLGPIIEQTTELAMPFVTDFLDGAIGLLDEVMPLISDLAASLLPILMDLVKQLLPPLLDLARAIIPPLVEILQAILPPLAGILLSILPMLVQIANMVLPVLVNVINALLPAIDPLLSLLMFLLQEVIFPLLDPLLMLVESLMPLIEPLLVVILASLKPLYDLLELLAPVLGTVIGWVAKIVDWVAQGLTWVVDLVFGDSAGDIAAGEIDAYAAGGFTNGVSIAGEAGTEAVISFDPAYRSQNLSYWAQAGRMLGADASDYYLGGASSAPSVDVGGVTFAPNISINGNASKQDIIAAIEETYPEFVDLVDRILNERGVGVYA